MDAIEISMVGITSQTINPSQAQKNFSNKGLLEDNVRPQKFLILESTRFC